MADISGQSLVTGFDDIEGYEYGSIEVVSPGSGSVTSATELVGAHPSPYNFGMDIHYSNESSAYREDSDSEEESGCLAKMEKREPQLIITGATCGLLMDAVATVGFATENPTLIAIGLIGYVPVNVLWQAEAAARWQKSKMETISQAASFAGFTGDAVATTFLDDESKEYSDLKIASRTLILAGTGFWGLSACISANQRKNMRTFCAKMISTVAAGGLLLASSLGVSDELEQDLNTYSKAAFGLSGMLWIAEGVSQLRARARREPSPEDNLREFIELGLTRMEADLSPEPKTRAPQATQHSLEEIKNLYYAFDGVGTDMENACSSVAISTTAKPKIFS